MPTEDADTAQSEAVEQLKGLGLSAYAARTFVALVGLGEGTAQEVSEAVNVPRTRVYDAAEELQERGLIDEKRSNPKRYWAISTETAARHFRQEYEQRITTMTEALDDIEPANLSTQQQGVWTVTGRHSVEERALEFVSDATDEVVYMTVEDLLTDDLAEALSDASDRGVSVRLAEMSDSATEQLEQSVPEAELFDSLWEFSDTPAGRLLMVDGEKTLVSVLVEGNGDHPPEPRDETAIWGSGDTNSLVIVLRTMFTWQLDGPNERNDVELSFSQQNYTPVRWITKSRLNT